MKHTPLTRNNDFVRAYKKGRCFVHPLLVLYVNKNRTGKTRLGITASKKIGGAVQRNRARRVIRAAVQQVLPLQAGKNDIVLVARAQTTHVKSQQVAQALATLLKKANLPLSGGPAQ